MYTTKQNSHFHHRLKRTCTPQQKLTFSPRTKAYMYTKRQNSTLHNRLKRTCTPQSKTQILTTEKSAHVHHLAKLTFSPRTKADMNTTTKTHIFATE